MEATREYRMEQDLLGHLIEECCTVGADCKGQATALYKAYREWSERSGENVATQRLFGTSLRERGFEKKTSGVVWWNGIELNSELGPLPDLGPSRTSF